MSSLSIPTSITTPPPSPRNKRRNRNPRFPSSSISILHCNAHNLQNFHLKSRPLSSSVFNDSRNRHVRSYSTTPSNRNTDTDSTTTTTWTNQTDLKHDSSTFMENENTINANTNSNSESLFSQIIPGSSPIAPESTTATLDGTATTIFSPTWYNPVDHTIQLLYSLDSFTDLPFAFTIMGTTLLIRTALVPLYISSQRNASRVAHMKPEMEALQAKYISLSKQQPQGVDIQTKQQMNAEMMALFQKYKCHPMYSLVLPLFQAPIFISMFFALQKMPLYDPYIPLFQNGGIAWFLDLSVPDPNYVLPILSSAIFIGTIELGKQNMMATSQSKQQAVIMTTVFRGLGVLMIPIAIQFPAAVLCYWVMNNSFTFVLSGLFQQPAIRKMAGIWELPKPVPGSSNDSAGNGADDGGSLTQMIKDAVKQNQKIQEMAQQEEEEQRRQIVKEKLEKEEDQNKK